MTQIKKILDKQGNEVFLRTSTKAVVDENGYTAESRLQAMQDEINQAQLEIGAVPSDLTPTEGSTNWVTSGGLYNQLNVGTNIEIDLTEYTAVRAYPTPNTWTVTNNTYPYYGIFIPITPGKYRITANETYGATYGFLKNNTYSQDAAVNYATNCTRVVIDANTFVIDTAPNDAKYLYIATYITHDTTPQKVEIYNKKSVVDILEDTDTEPIQNSDNLITSGGVFNQVAYQNILFKNTSATVWNSGNIQDGKIITTYSNKYIKLAIPSGVETIHYNRIVVDSTIYNSFYVSNNESSGYVRIYLNQDNTLNVNGYSYLIILLFDKPTLEQAQAENINVCIINKLSSSRTIEAINNLDYILENNIFELSNATVGQTDTSIMTCTIDGDIIKFVATGSKTALKYGYINIPLGTLNYERYKIIFDYEAVIGSNSDGYFTIANTTGSRGVIRGTNLKTGKSSASFTFNLVESPVCLKMESNALGDSGCYVYIKNLRIVPYNGESYRTIPQLDSIIQDIVDSQNIIPSTVSPVPYGGNKILSINSGNVIGIKKLMTCKGGQAGASYGDYYFQFADNHEQLNIYNLSSAAFLSSVTMASNSNNHCNTSCFSKIFYDTNDIFPLIYTSGSRVATYNHIQVWRIQLENDVFSISKIQEITLPSSPSSNWSWGQAYLDNELGYLWYATNGKNATYYKFNIPAIFSDGVVVEDVTLTESDIIDSFITEKNRNQQGGVIKNGTLYLFDGVPSWGTSTRLYVVDIWGKRLVNVIDIQNLFNLTVEFEGCGIYNDTLIASTSGGIYAIYF